jgi:transposase
MLNQTSGTRLCLLEGGRDWLVDRIARNKSLTPHELLETRRSEHGVVVSCNTLWRFLKRCGKSF